MKLRPSNPMRRRRNFAPFVIVTLAATRVFAIPFEDNDVRERTREILSRAEYQPRRATEGFFDAYKRLIGEYLENLFERIAKWIEGIEGPVIGDSSIAKWLVEALLLLREAMYLIVIITVVTVILYCAYKILLPLIRDRQSVVVVPKKEEASTSEESFLPLAELITSQRYRDALASMHRSLRRHFQRHYNIPLSATDNEVEHLLPQEVSQRRLFSEIASSFESVVYANSEPEPEAINALYSRFDREGGSP